MVTIFLVYWLEANHLFYNKVSCIYIRIESTIYIKFEHGWVGIVSGDSSIELVTHCGGTGPTTVLYNPTETKNSHITIRSNLISCLRPNSKAWVKQFHRER